ncbi:MAG: phosphonate metabolism protein/1,5-bisphosphokinase (PRPP-forming) PhnN [Phreatobacter sp.]|uniref:phosphonate metabolism protein/1,5-bisphosphokinase (PRPP-forming) PhnN n=1 Tax=Phreatobacter sp. TaxID=1966341 RepID=UPI001A46F782|nr:phosphonate metabolism protein/1,5-bisphosphokinase (PRPP-forming) PhnN [Phreatobacter sp.]MBL8570214.1 phosphonate metabolism protein/1,5-bisphosphokinase (PRPP-forming) PhnN [Phreatobacter sp.]
MSEAGASTVPAAIGPGRLILVVGPSGAGKDTLIGHVRQRLAGDEAYLFPRRIVTRPPSPAEDNVEADAETFAAIAKAGGFALAWSAHGHSYGIPAAIDHALHEGRTVLSNVSREIVAAARRRYADVTVIEITAPADVLRARIAGRSRASDGDASSRADRRVTAPVEPDVVIVNDTDVEGAASRLLAVVTAPAGRRIAS